MTDTGTVETDGPPLQWVEALALIVIVCAAGAAARALTSSALVSPRVSAIVVGVCAGVVGLPVLAWFSERGSRRWPLLVAAGSLAGLLPPILLAVSGAVGLLLLGGGEYAWWALGKGASIPAYGTLAWPKFAGLMLWSGFIGSASAVIWAALVPTAGWRRPASWGIAALALAALIGLGAVL